MDLRELMTEEEYKSFKKLTKAGLVGEEETKMLMGIVDVPYERRYYALLVTRHNAERILRRPAMVKKFAKRLSAVLEFAAKNSAELNYLKGEDPVLIHVVGVETSVASSFISSALLQMGKTLDIENLKEFDFTETWQRWNNLEEIIKKTPKDKMDLEIYVQERILNWAFARNADVISELDKAVDLDMTPEKIESEKQRQLRKRADLKKQIEVVEGLKDSLLNDEIYQNFGKGLEEDKKQYRNTKYYNQLTSAGFSINLKTVQTGDNVSAQKIEVNTPVAQAQEEASKGR